MLRQFHVAGFKSLQDVEAELEPLNVAFGPNGSGKSNFCEALLFLSEAVQQPSIHKALSILNRTDRLHLFHDAVQRFDVAENTSSLQFSASGSFERAGRSPIQYTVTVQYVPQTGEVGLSSEGLYEEGPNRKAILRMDVDPEEGSSLYLSSAVAVDGSGLDSVSRVLPDRAMASDRFLQDQDEAYPALASLRLETLDWSSLVLDDMRSMRNDAEPSQVRTIGRHGERLAAFFHRLLNDEDSAARQAHSALVRSIRTFLPDIREFAAEVNPSTGRVALRTRLRDRWFSAGSLSDGSLRVIGICAEALNPYSRGILIVEEPELGIHPQRIVLVASLLQAAARQRQVFVSTHSPELVGEFVRLGREADAVGTRLLGFSSTSSGTKISEMTPTDPRLDDAELRQDLGSDSAASTMREMLIRGWLNG